MDNRRKFIKKLGLLGLGVAEPGILKKAPGQKEIELITDNKKPLHLSILQTTDVHCQLHPHVEFFWENNQAVFKKTGGYASISTAFHQMKSKNPNTFIVDTGDMSQGSELAVETTNDVLCRMRNVINPSVQQDSLHQVIIAYLQVNSPVTPSLRQDCKVLDAPQELLTQVSGVDYNFY